MDDAEGVRALAGNPAIYATTLNVPHPYEEGMAEKWIATHAVSFYERRGLCLAVCEKDRGQLAGTVSFGIANPHQRAELGWWIGEPFWNRGYCTEAAAALVAYGFENFPIRKFTSHYLASNPASGRVMQKIGMQQEGYLHQHVVKEGVRHDIVLYGLLKPRLGEAPGC